MDLLPLPALPSTRMAARFALTGTGLFFPAANNDEEEEGDPGGWTPRALRSEEDVEDGVEDAAELRTEAVAAVRWAGG